MTSIYLFSFILVVSLFEMPQAKCLPCRPWTPSCNQEELRFLETLTSALKENKNSKSLCKNNIDGKEIIMKLINALVYTAINNIKNGRCGEKRITGSRRTEAIGDSDNILKLDLAEQKALSIGLGDAQSSSSKDITQNYSDKGLINLDVLKPNDPDNVLKLDIADQKVLGIGWGDTVPDSSKDTTKTDTFDKLPDCDNTNPNCYTTQNDSSEELIDLDLLNPNNPDNILKLDIADQKVLGIGLGDTVPDSSKDTTKTDTFDKLPDCDNTNPNCDTTQNDSDKGLIDLVLLNQNNPDNILKLDIADQKVLGIGLGDTVPDSSIDTTKTDTFDKLPDCDNTNPNCDTTQNDSDKGLIDLDLINQNNPDNILKLDIADQKVLGIGLGDTVPDSSKDTTKSDTFDKLPDCDNTNPNCDTTQNDSDKGLIDLDLLNPNNPDNMLKLEIADQNVLGVGLGDTSN